MHNIDCSMGVTRRFTLGGAWFHFRQRLVIPHPNQLAHASTTNRAQSGAGTRATRLYSRVPGIPRRTSHWHQCRGWALRAAGLKRNAALTYPRGRPCPGDAFSNDGVVSSMRARSALYRLVHRTRSLQSEGSISHRTIARRTAP